jgi:Ca-activated chloride channel family protein
MIRFQHPEYLLWFIAVPILVVLFILLLLWRKRILDTIGDPKIANAQFLGRIPGRAALKAVFLLAALSLAIIGAANLQGGGHPEQVQRKGVDVMIALDVSKSMLAQDLQPDRLTRAKQFIERMLDKLHNDRVGLIIFAGRAYLQVPLTVDYSSMRLMLQNARPSLVPTQGTVIGDAIGLGMRSFSQKEKKHKAMIVLSDGEDHDEQAGSKALY